MVLEKTRSDAVDQDIQRAFQGVAVGRQRAGRCPQLPRGDRGQLLHPDEPALARRLDHRRQLREGGMGPLSAQGCYDARGVEADQIRLQIDARSPSSKRRRLNCAMDVAP